MNKRTSIHELIDLYVSRLRKNTMDEADFLHKLSQTIREQGLTAQYTLHALRNGDSASLLLSTISEFIRSWPSRGKAKVAEAMKKFAKYLLDFHNVPINPEDLPKVIPDLTQRRLDMLRFLHKPRSKQELEERYLVSERTLRDDINALEMGWQVMGNTIRINRNEKDGKISYNSTAHSLLLALNLTEVYALAVGFPQLAKGSAFEDIAEYLSRAMVSQLSDYAQGILAKSNPVGNLAQALEDGVSYRKELDVLVQSRKSNLIYLMKQGMRCRVQFEDGQGGVRSVEGVPELLPDRWEMIHLRGADEDIPLDRIVVVERLEEYR